MDPRLEEINSLLISYSLGDFNQKIEPSGKLDDIDAFISNINMLGEELKISTISRNYFNNIFHSVSDMLFVLDANGNINSINKAVTDTLNFKEIELKGRSINIIEGGLDFFKNLKKEMQSAPLVHIDRTMHSIGQEPIPVSCSCSFLYNQNGETIGYLLIARNQARIKRYERSLTESEKKYRSIFESSQDCLFILDSESHFVDINEAGIKLFKYPIEVLKTKRIRDVIYDQAKRIIIRQELDAKGSITDAELLFRDTHNNIITCLISASAIHNEAGEVMGWQGIIKDISQQKKTESLVIKAIVDTQEKERIRIARDIHDSLGQKLSGIMFYLGALKSMQKVGKAKYDVVLKKSNEALVDVIDELSTISFNLMPGTLQHFGLKQAINELCHKIELSSQVKIKFAMKDGIIITDKTIEITLFRITQEFINNAIKHGKAKKVSVQIGMDKKKKNIIAVLKDNGIGFEIKKRNEYKGMGLKNVNSRVEAHNGSAKIDSVPNKGTIYEIIIPC